MAADPEEREAESGSPRPAPHKAFRELAALGLAAAVVLGTAGAWVLSRQPRADPKAASLSRVRSRFVGAASCRECHPGESALYHRSGHGQTLRLASDRRDLLAWLDGKSAADPSDPRATFRYRVEAGRLMAARESGGSRAERPLEYAFGSGRHGTTFVTLTDRDPAHPAGIEHRLTCYADGPHLDVTPGQAEGYGNDPRRDTPEGRLLDAEAVTRCFSCHITTPSDRDDKRLDVTSMIADVSCERCHGPGGDHVEAARRGATNLRMPFGKGRARPLEEIRMCGACHRLPEDAARGAIRPDNRELLRFQPIGLLASACFNGSGGALGCTTCHDPHARTSTDTAAYEAACLKCHRAAPQPVCKVSPGSGCIACHMPRKEAGQGVSFTDHWIRTIPGGTDPRKH